MITTSTIYRNTRRVNEETSKLDAAMEVAGFLEQVGAFAFDNWVDGELVFGPLIEKYYVTVKLMFPQKLPPNPAVFDRLTNLECIVELEKDTYKRVALVKDNTRSSIEMGSGEAFQKQMFTHKVWVLTLKVPQRYLALDGNTMFNIDGEDILFNDLEAIYQTDEQEELNNNSGGSEPDEGGDEGFEF